MIRVRRILARLRHWAGAYLSPACTCPRQFEHDDGCPWSDAGVGT